MGANALMLRFRAARSTLHSLFGWQMSRRIYMALHAIHMDFARPLEDRRSTLQPVLCLRMADEPTHIPYIYYIYIWSIYACARTWILQLGRVHSICIREKCPSYGTLSDASRVSSTIVVGRVLILDPCTFDTMRYAHLHFLTRVQQYGMVSGSSSRFFRYHSSESKK